MVCCLWFLSGFLDVCSGQTSGMMMSSGSEVTLNQMCDVSCSHFTQSGLWGRGRFIFNLVLNDELLSECVTVTWRSPLFLFLFLFLVLRRRWSVRGGRGHVWGGVSLSLSALTGALGWTATDGLDTNKHGDSVQSSTKQKRNQDIDPSNRTLYRIYH